MIELRAADTMGRSRAGDLEAVHHFSFGGYQDLSRDGWGALRVLNHVRLEPYADRSAQPIDGVDIVTFVRTGAIAHHGSLAGNCRTLAGEAQLLCPGPGMLHADSNPAARAAEYVELRLAMEQVPERPQRRLARFPGRVHTGRLMLLASGFHEDRAPLPLQSGTRIYAARIPAQGRITHMIDPGRRAYLVALNGTVRVNGVAVDAKEGAAIEGEREVVIEAQKFAEILLVELR